MSLTRKVAHNTIIQIIAKGIGIGLGLVTVGLLTRHLGREGFGQYTTVQAFLQVFAVLVDLGLYLVLIQMISRPGADTSKITSNIFTLKFVTSFLFLALAPIVAWFIPSYSLAIKLGIAIMAADFLFGSLIQIMTAVFQYKLAMIKVSLAEVAGRIVLVGLVGLAVYLDKGLLFIFWMILISALVNFLIVFVSSRQFVRITFRFDRDVWREVFVSGWPLALSVALTLVYFKGDTVILSLVRTQAEVGIYGAPYRILEVLVMLPPIFTGLVLSPLSFSWAEGNREKFGRIIQKSFDFFAIFIIPMIVGTLFLSERIMVFVAGPDFAVSSNVLKILMFATGMIFLGNIFCKAAVAINRQKSLLWFYLLTAVVALVGYLVFIPKYSYYGAAWMTVVAESVMAISAFLLIRHASGFSPSFKIFFKSVLAGLVMAIPLYFLAGWNLILLIALSGLAYSAALCLLGGISKEVVREIIRAEKK